MWDCRDATTSRMACSIWSVTTDTVNGRTCAAALCPIWSLNSGDPISRSIASAQCPSIIWRNQNSCFAINNDILKSADASGDHSLSDGRCLGGNLTPWFLPYGGNDTHGAVGPCGHDLVMIHIQGDADIISKVRVSSRGSSSNYYKGNPALQSTMSFDEYFDSFMFVQSADEEKVIALGAKRRSSLRECNIAKALAQKGWISHEWADQMLPEIRQRVQRKSQRLAQFSDSEGGGSPEGCRNHRRLAPSILTMATGNAPV